MDVPDGYDSVLEVHDDVDLTSPRDFTPRPDETVEDTSEVVERTLETLETFSEADSNGYTEVESAFVEFGSDTMAETESNDQDSDDWRDHDLVHSELATLHTTVGGYFESDLNVQQYPDVQDLDADLACMLPADNSDVETTNERCIHLQALRQFLDFPNNDLCYPQTYPYHQPHRPVLPYPLYNSRAFNPCGAVDTNCSDISMRPLALRLFLLVSSIGSLLLLRSYGAIYILVADCCSSLLLEVFGLTILLALLIFFGRL